MGSRYTTWCQPHWTHHECDVCGVTPDDVGAIVWGVYRIDGEWRMFCSTQHADAFKAKPPSAVSVVDVQEEGT